MSTSRKVAVIGSGMGSLTAACLLAQKGFQVTIFEQNWIPGGCTTSYPRKNYVFESGATTLVGLDEGMPLHYLLKQTGIKINARRLKTPMQVHFSDGTVLTRYEKIEKWISEAENFFGGTNQRKFWTSCFRTSQFVWDTSIKQRTFPPSSFGDLLGMLGSASLNQFRMLPLGVRSTRKLLAKHELLDNPKFVDFVNEQLLITAQNTLEEVNQLFGATALCYTNFGNYYVDGGLRNLVQPLVDYIEAKGGKLLLRHDVTSIQRQEKGYRIQTKKHGDFEADLLLSGIPINNTLQLMDEELKGKFSGQTLESEKLVSAFQMGLVFRKRKTFDCIHHQIHLEEPLPGCGSHSIFLSLSHPEDTSRCAADEVVASVSTHIPDPAHTFIDDKSPTEEAILDALVKHGFLEREDLIFSHSSTPKSWKKWTGREWGFVGGYPQYLSIKPWQMNDARLDGKGAYLCGDSAYPGQGIPGVTLSGIIAAEKMIRDHF